MTKLINQTSPYIITVVDGEIVEFCGKCYFFCPYELKETLYETLTRPLYNAEFRLWSINASEKVKLELWQKEHATLLEQEFETWVSKSDLKQLESAKGLIQINCTPTGLGLLKEKFDDAVLIPTHYMNEAIFLRPDQVNEAVHYLEHYYSAENKKLRKQAVKKQGNLYKPDPILSAFDLYKFAQEK